MMGMIYKLSNMPHNAKSLEVGGNNGGGTNCAVCTILIGLADEYSVRKTIPVDHVKQEKSFFNIFFFHSN